MKVWILFPFLFSIICIKSIHSYDDFYDDTDDTWTDDPPIDSAVPVTSVNTVYDGANTRDRNLCEMDNEWKDNLDTTLQNAKRIGTKIARHLVAFTSNCTINTLEVQIENLENNLFEIKERIDISTKKISDVEKDFATMLDRLSELKFLITESSNSCKVDVQRQRRPPNVNMMERLGELVTHFSEAVPQLTSVVENLRVFKINFERDLHRNQNEIWMRFLTVVEDLQGVVTFSEETTRQQIKELARLITKEKSPLLLESKADLPNEDSSNPEMIKKSALLDPLMRSNIGKRVTPSRSAIESGTWRIRQELTNDVDDDIFDIESKEKNLKSTKPSANITPRKVGLGFGARRSGSVLEDLDTTSSEKLAGRVTSKANLTTNEQLTIRRGDKQIQDSKKQFEEVFHNEELSRPQRKIDPIHGEPKIINIPISSLRITHEMEQLSKCLDLSVVKYEDFLVTMKEQNAVSMMIKGTVDIIQETATSRTWMETGFFVFCGFVFGVLVGIVSTSLVALCIQKHYGKVKDPEIFEMTRPTLSHCNLSAAQPVESGSTLTFKSAACNS